MKFPLLKKVIQQLIFILVFASLAACQSKPSKDDSVDYKSERSIPSLQIPDPDENEVKR